MIGYLLLATTLSFILIFLYRQYNLRMNKTKPFLFYVGLGHILMGIPLIPSYLLFIGLYFLIFGIIYILLSYKISNIKFQLTLLFVPMLFLVSFFYYEESSKNIFLIPENYKGRVLIVHDCENGQPKEFQGWFWRKYIVGKDGIAYSQFSFAGDSFDHLNTKYFYVDDKGNRKELKEEFSSEDNKNSVPSPKIFGLWSIAQTTESNKTNIDFIIDDEYSEPSEYHKEEMEDWIQKSKFCD